MHPALDTDVQDQLPEPEEKIDSRKIQGMNILTQEEMAEAFKMFLKSKGLSPLIKDVEFYDDCGGRIRGDFHMRFKMDHEAIAKAEVQAQNSSSVGAVFNFAKVRPQGQPMNVRILGLPKPFVKALMDEQEATKAITVDEVRKEIDKGIIKLRKQIDGDGKPFYWFE